jgi:hypothetical protein
VVIFLLPVADVCFGENLRFLFDPYGAQRIRIIFEGIGIRITVQDVVNEVLGLKRMQMARV